MARARGRGRSRSRYCRFGGTDRRRVRTGAHWARVFADAVPLSTIRAVNEALGRIFVTTFGMKIGILAIGKAAPFGVGALLGASGNFTVAKMTIKSTRKAFGPAPEKRHAAVG